VGPEDLHPVQQVRAGLPARRDPRQGLRPRTGARRRARHLQVRDLQGQGLRRLEVHDPGRARGLHRLRLCVAVCPAKDNPNPRTRRSTWRRRRRCASRSARTTTSSSTCPRPTATKRQARREGHAVPRAAVRVLGRVRGLRRDAVHQAAHAALRRPPAHRERHRLLVDLRRQPADDALHDQPRRAAARPGPTRSSKTTPSSAWACGSASTRRQRVTRANPALTRRELGDELVAALLEADQGRRGGHRRAARARGRELVARSRRIDPRARRSSTRPTTS
jgi:hypothetical protein